MMGKQPVRARGKKDKDDGEPETLRFDESWQLTTWLSENEAWVVRIDGPDEWHWEESKYLSRVAAAKKGSDIIEGMRSGPEQT